MPDPTPQDHERARAVAGKLGISPRTRILLERAITRDYAKVRAEQRERDAVTAYDRLFTMPKLAQEVCAAIRRGE